MFRIWLNSQYVCIIVLLDVTQYNTLKKKKSSHIRVYPHYNNSGVSAAFSIVDYGQIANKHIEAKMFWFSTANNLVKGDQP